jgi:hypothetical protein
LEGYVAALKALKAGAPEVQVGTQVIARADWLASVAEGCRRRERTGSAELPSAVEARIRLLEG